MDSIEVTMAVGDHDRVRALKDGEVELGGIDLNVVHRPVTELFRHVSTNPDFPLTEMSLSTYTLWNADGTCPYVGLPVFLSRFFRHSCIYVSDESAITEPADLKGKKVGAVPEYQATATTYVRGMLQDEYGVEPSDLVWYTEQSERRPIDLPAGVEKHVLPDVDLADMLARGELDALVTTHIPDSLGDGVRRLFPDFKRAEKAYYRTTNVYPIMHLLLMHEDLYADYPWMATTLYNAMEEAKDLAIDRLYDADSLQIALPWLLDHIEESRETFGDDYWPYGFERNRDTLEALTRYSHEQGLSSRKVDPEELIVDELLDT